MVYVIVSIVLAVAWIPLLIRFLRGWHSRKNPVSLAICAMIATSIYNCTTNALNVMGHGALEVVRMLAIAIQAFVIVNFYFAFHWSSQRFPDSRRASGSIPPINVSKSTDAQGNIKT